MVPSGLPRSAELDPIVGENRVDLVGDSRDQSFEESRGGGSSRLPDQLHEGKLARAIDGDVEVELAFIGLKLSNVDVEVADRVGLELFLSSGNRLMPWSWRQRCRDDRVRCGMVGWSA